MRKTLGLAALVAATAGVVVPVVPASAADHCQYVAVVAERYAYLDRKAHDALPDISWYCHD